MAFSNSHARIKLHIASGQVVLNFTLLMIVWLVVVSISPYIGRMYHMTAVVAVSNVLNTNAFIGKETWGC